MTGEADIAQSKLSKIDEELDNIDFLLLREPNYGKREWWAANYPGFTPEQCELLEIYTWAEAHPKEIKAKIKKQCRRKNLK